MRPSLMLSRRPSSNARTIMSEKAGLQKLYRPDQAGAPPSMPAGADRFSCRRNGEPGVALRVLCMSTLVTKELGFNM